MKPASSVLSIPRATQTKKTPAYDRKAGAQVPPKPDAQTARFLKAVKALKGYI